jgi:uncharacterized membrane protein
MTTATPGSATFGRRHTDQPERRFHRANDEGSQSSRGFLGGPLQRARGLAWFSLGLGLAQVAAPRRVSRLIGVPDDDATRNAMFAIGLREIASGIGILATDRPVAPVWSRVGGDVMDLALLRRAMTSHRAEKHRLAAATAAVVGVTLLDWLTGKDLSRNGESAGTGTNQHVTIGKEIEVRRAITIWAPLDQVYQFWRDFENLPRFMQHLESVRVLDDRRSHWVAKAPAGTSVEWDAEMVEDRPNELISWRTVGHADIPNQGTVRFLPAQPGGTEVRVELHYQAPGGRLGALVAKLFGEEPDIQVGSDLRRLKQVMELGEVVHSDATVHGHPHPAQPSDKPTDLRQQSQRTTEGAAR